MAHKGDWKIEPQSCHKLSAYLTKITKMEQTVDGIKISEMKKMLEIHKASAFEILGVTKGNLEQAYLHFWNTPFTLKLCRSQLS